jgi:copper oxidase (laccase) domain-containing protein
LKEKNMIRHEQNELVYFSYHLFEPCERMLSVVSSRQGGVSAQPYDSLNRAFNVGDDPAAVMTNRVLLCEAI